MRRAVSLVAVIAALAAGLSFATAQPSGKPRPHRFADLFQVGYGVVISPVSDGTAFQVELLTDKEQAEADQARAAAEADADDARKGLETLTEELRRAESALVILAPEDEAGAMDFKDRIDRSTAAIARVKKRLENAERIAARRAFSVVEVGEDYFTYAEDKRVYVPLDRVVTVTQRK